MKKLTIEFVRKQFEKEGYILLSNEYVDCKKRLKYICPKKHFGSIIFDNWRQGHRCKTCGNITVFNKRRLSLEFVKKQFEKENYQLLTEKYINSKISLKYMCPNKHIGNITWNSWQQGARCPYCAGQGKPTIEFIRSEFEKEGYKLLSKEYKNNKQKLDYICPKGHKHNISWRSWQNGARCAECSGNKKHTIEFIKRQFEKENYILLTRKYEDVHQKLEYICPVGHKHSMSFNHWQRGYRCQECFFVNNRGQNSSRWNPNLTDEERKIRRNYLEYSEWSYAVKKRDNFTCQVCGDNTGKNLVSHHLESYTSNPSLRTVLSNGICLCQICHEKFHTVYGYGNNTKKQFNKFLGDNNVCTSYNTAGF